MISNSRQSLVKGERLVRHDMRPVLSERRNGGKLTMATSDDRDGCKLTTNYLPNRCRHPIYFPKCRGLSERRVLEEWLARGPIKIRVAAE